MKKSNLARRVAALMLLLIVGGPMVVSAQVTTGTISGTISDQSNAVLPGVSVKATHVETGTIRSAVTGTRGEYRFVSLLVGGYRVEASLAGFQTSVRSGIELTVGRDAVVDLVLNVGDVTEQVTVTGEAPLIETTTATVGGVVDAKAMRDIPLNARSFLELVPLQTGAVLAEAGSTDQAHGYGKKLSISGARYTSNVFLLDGAVMNDFFGSAGSAAGTLAGVETVREFRVITNAFDAEYGRHTGGVISAVTKSGTNQLHGSLFEFLRNDNMDARNFFDRNPNRPLERSNPPEFRRNQFGGAAGGPILPDKTFFFGSYEGLREALGETRTINVPGLGARQGFIGTQNIGIASNARPYFETYPIPNTVDRPDGTAQFITGVTKVTDEDFWTARIDHRFSDSDSIFGRVTIDDAQRRTPAPSGFNIAEILGTDNRFVTLEETHIYSPALIGRTHFSFSRAKNTGFEVPDGGAVFPKLAFGGSPEVPGGFTVTGLTQWGGSQSTPKRYAQNSFQYREDLTFSTARQSIKFGFHGERIQSNIRSDTNTVYTFGSLTDFMRGTSSTLISQVPGSDAIRGWRQNLVGLYIQDDISLKPGLTVNLGLRYEFISVPKEVNGKVANIRDLTPAHLNIVRPDQTDIGDPFFVNPSLKNFGPRVGFAWDPFPRGKTSIRGGLGLFHEPILPAYYILAGVRAAPFYSQATLRSNEVVIDFPNAYATQVSRGITGGTLPQIDGWEFNISQPAVMKWSFDIQHQLGQEATMSAGYAASRGTHLMRGSLSVNATPIEMRDGKPFFLIQGLQANPYWGRMRFPAFDGTSDYHSLQLNLTKRFSRGLQFHSAYTFSKATDTGAIVQGGADFTDGADRASNMRDKEPGLASYDVRHSFYSNFVYDLPGSGLTGAKAHLLGGWSLAGLLRFNSGNPINIGTTRARLGTLQFLNVGGSSIDLVPGGEQNPVRPRNADEYFDVTQFSYPGTNCMTNVIGPAAVCNANLAPGQFIGNVGRNVMISPGITTLDFTMTKNTAVKALGEGGSLQFRAEFFNLLNRANFAPPSARNVFDQTGRLQSGVGQITATRSSSRQIQLALKLLF